MKMPTPTKHSKTGMYYLGVRVPADLVKVIGKRFHKRTLGTKDPAIAKGLFIERHAALLKHWDTLRAGPQSLSHRQRNALAGVRYRENVAILGDNPESVTIWERMFLRYTRASETPAGLEGVFGGMSCCRFRGHEDKIVILELEDADDTTEVQPRVQG